MTRRWLCTFAVAEGVGDLVFHEAVVALGCGVGVVDGDRGVDGRPPRFDGRGEAVHPGRGRGGGLPVLAPQPSTDDGPLAGGRAPRGAAPYAALVPDSSRSWRRFAWTV